MTASARLRATAEAVPSVHETSQRAVRALLFGVPPAALGVAGWPAWGASLPLTTGFFVSVAMVAAVVSAAAIVDEPNARGCGARQAPALRHGPDRRLPGEPRTGEVRQPRPVHKDR